MLKYLAAWRVFGFAMYVFFFFAPLNRVTISLLGIPLGFYLARKAH